MSLNNPIAVYTIDVYKSPVVYEDIASLQVIDYICGNADRHERNYFFRFDPYSNPPKIVGVSGIDNDLSFPEKEIIERNGHPFANPDNMNVIGEEMANEVMALTEESLKKALTGYELNDKQIALCWERAKKLRKRCLYGILILL